MARKISTTIKEGASKMKSSVKRFFSPLPCVHDGTETTSDQTAGPADTSDASEDKTKHTTTLIERVHDTVTNVNSRRKSITSSILHRSRHSMSLDIARGDPLLPPELIEKIASYMTQHELLRFSKVSRDCYTAAERHLYRRPFTRRFDKLLRTLERSPYKADLIIELALGFETDFYSVKGPNYDREIVYSAILSKTRNLQQLIYQGWLQWTVSVTQPFAARHAYVMTIPTRVQTGAVPLELLENIPSTLKHLQFRRIYGKYHNLFEVIQRNNSLETLNLYEIGDLESLHLEKMIDLPIAQSLRVLRIRHLPHHADTDHGALVAKILPHLMALQTFTMEISSLEDEPFFSTFARCKQIQNFKLGYCERVTPEGLSKLSRHGELRSLELMPCVRFQIDTLRTIISGNPRMALLLLPKETISETMHKDLSYNHSSGKINGYRSLLIGNTVRIYIKPPSREFELTMRQRLARPGMMQLVWR